MYTSCSVILLSITGNCPLVKVMVTEPGWTTMYNTNHVLIDSHHHDDHNDVDEDDKVWSQNKNKHITRIH